jgi:hypothetical protein
MQRGYSQIRHYKGDSSHSAEAIKEICGSFLCSVSSIPGGRNCCATLMSAIGAGFGDSGVDNLEELFCVGGLFGGERVKAKQICERGMEDTQRQAGFMG